MLGESTLTLIGPDTPNLALINFFVLLTFRGGTSDKKTPCTINLLYNVHAHRIRLDPGITKQGPAYGRPISIF